MAARRAHKSRRLAPALAAAVLSTTGCSAPSPQRGTPTQSAAAAIDADAFAAASGVLSGFDLAASPDDWNIGDRVLLAIRSHKHSTVTMRYLLVELTGHRDPAPPMEFRGSAGRDRPFRLQSDLVQTQLTLLDERGEVLTRVNGRFARDLLGLGLFDGVEPLAAHPQWRERRTHLLTDLDDAAADRVLRGWMTLFSFSGSLGRKGLFRDMLGDLVARPGFLRMLFNPSVSLGFADDWPEAAQPWSTGDGRPDIDTIRVPIECVIAGKRAASAVVLAARPVAPLSLCGGVISVDACNADDPGIRTHVRLIAAARGRGGQDFAMPAEPVWPERSHDTGAD